MKSVVSSLVALAIALAPLGATARPTPAKDTQAREAKGVDAARARPGALDKSATTDRAALKEPTTKRATTKAATAKASPAKRATTKRATTKAATAKASPAKRATTKGATAEAAATKDVTKKRVASKSANEKRTPKAEVATRADRTHKTVVENVHHAHRVDLAGSGHGEPKADRRGVLVTASMTTKAPVADEVDAAPEISELPPLPRPDADEPATVAARKIAPDDREDSAKMAEVAPDDREDSAKATALETVSGPAAGERDEDVRAEVPAAKEPSRRAKVDEAAAPKSPPCKKDPVEIVRGPEIERFALTKCDGGIAPLAIERLSVLVRPGAAARPTASAAALAKKTGAELAPGIRRVDERLVERIQAIAEHFSKPGSPAKLFIISGYRPASVGSMHSSGRAIDFRIEGVQNEDIVTFCKTLEDTGCGYYPNSSFVHVDVRNPGAGHVTWIDASGPGESPRYVPVWPPPAVERHVHRASAMEPARDLVEEGERLLRARRPLEREAGEEDLHPAELP